MIRFNLEPYPHMPKPNDTLYGTDIMTPGTEPSSSCSRQTNLSQSYFEDVSGYIQVNRYEMLRN